MSLGHRIRAVASLVPAPRAPTPVTPIASVESDWDDDAPVDFQNDGIDDTINVAVAAVAAAAAAEKHGMVEEPKVNGGANVSNVANGVPPESPPALPVMIRVANSGAVVTNKGGSEELAGVVAYAHRLIELVGDMLGLERFMAAECVFKAAQGEAAPGAAGGQERCLLFTETDGDTVLVRPRAEGDLRALRETLGL